MKDFTNEILSSKAYMAEHSKAIAASPVTDASVAEKELVAFTSEMETIVTFEVKSPAIALLADNGQEALNLEVGL